ncbi:MAG: RDD family protein [Candidatus Eremiobacteraeota bacterium]|nr:RDD family protein [Candidatus Eremiobacteraeota bacterium]
MDRTLAVRTPESIAFSYDLAGLGSRFLAMLLDLLAQVTITGLVIWALVAISGHSPPPAKLTSAEEKLTQSIAIAIIIFMVFTIFFGYFIIFEAAWNGQTPGKRLIGIRVVRDGGYPIDFMSSLIRNLVRTLEFGIGFYLLSAITSLASQENKRLGDYAAGTIVVRDSGIVAPTFPTQNSAPSIPASDEERALVARFIERRSALLPARRAELAQQIAAMFRPRLSADLAGLDDEKLIEQVDAALS